MSIEAAVEQFIVDELLYGHDQRRLQPDQSLVGSGILDSLALLRLIVFLEEQYGVSIQDGQVIPDNFDSLLRIRAFVQRQLEARPTP